MTPATDTLEVENCNKYLVVDVQVRGLSDVGNLGCFLPSSDLLRES